MDKKETYVGSISSKNKLEVCLMTKGESKSSQVSAASSNKCESYFELLDAFQEIHEEAKRLTFLNNRLICENNKLKMKITILEKDLNQSKTDLENSEWCMKNPLANVIQFFAKIVSLFKRKFYIL